jgi:hypothetical protein
MEECDDTPPASAIARVGATEVWQALTSNEELLLVCAYGDDQRFRQVPLVGAIARSQLDAWIPQLPKEQSIVFYCQ